MLAARTDTRRGTRVCPQSVILAAKRRQQPEGVCTLVLTVMLVLLQKLVVQMLALPVVQTATRRLRSHNVMQRLRVARTVTLNAPTHGHSHDHDHGHDHGHGHEGHDLALDLPPALCVGPLPAPSVCMAGTGLCLPPTTWTRRREVCNGVNDHAVPCLWWRGVDDRLLGRGVHGKVPRTPMLVLMPRVMVLPRLRLLQLLQAPLALALTLTPTLTLTRPVVHHLAARQDAALAASPWHPPRQLHHRMAPPLTLLHSPTCMTRRQTLLLIPVGVLQLDKQRRNLVHRSIPPTTPWTGWSWSCSKSPSRCRLKPAVTERASQHSKPLLLWPPRPPETPLHDDHPMLLLLLLREKQPASKRAGPCNASQVLGTPRVNMTPVGTDTGVDGAIATAVGIMVHHGTLVHANANVGVDVDVAALARSATHWPVAIRVCHHGHRVAASTTARTRHRHSPLAHGSELA